MGTGAETVSPGRFLPPPEPPLKSALVSIQEASTPCCQCCSVESVGCK